MVKWAIVHLPYIHIKGMMKDYSGFVTTVGTPDPQPGAQGYTDFAATPRLRFPTWI